MDKFVSPNEEALFGASDSETIQNAIAAAVKDGCRKVVIPRWNARRDETKWVIGKAIRIPDHFTIVLDNCYLIQETGVFDHIFTNEHSYEPEIIRTLEGEAKDITILGVGNTILDGGEHNHLLEKTRGKYGLPSSVLPNTMFFFVNVDGLRVENLHIQNQRWWAFTHIFCRNAKLKNLDFFAIPHVNNMDGIDLRVGCNHFEIENITGRTGDDNIALTALPCGGIETRFKVEGKDPDIHDVTIKNVKGDPYYCYNVRLLNQDGSKIYNIDIDTIMDVSDFTKKKPSGSCVGIGAVLYWTKRRAVPGETHHITARNITSRSGITVMLNNTCEDSLFSNIKTYGDNKIAVGAAPGASCELHNVKVEHLFYGAKQQEIFCSKDLAPEHFVGTAIQLDHFSGEIQVEDVVIDKVKTAVSAKDASIRAEIDGMTWDVVHDELVQGKDSEIKINGEVRS